MSVIPPREVEFVEQAAGYLEHPGFLVRLADLVGMPLEAFVKMAPDWVSETVNASLRRGLDFALFTLGPGSLDVDDFSRLAGRAWWVGYRHSAITALTGGAAGLFGRLALSVELPITTCVLLRSMAAIARNYGEDLSHPAVRLECLSLFAMGGPSSADDEMDSSYYTLRTSMSGFVKHAAEFVAHTPKQQVLTSIKNGTAPFLIGLLGKILPRFEVSTSEKVLAQTIPMIGAVGGATINVMFAEHFSGIARFHFGLRHLERLRGREPIHAIYQEAIRQDAGRRRAKLNRWNDRGASRDPAFASSVVKPR